MFALAGVLAWLLTIASASGATPKVDATRGVILHALQEVGPLMRDGEFERARDLLLELERSYPRSNDIDFLLGQIALAQKDYDTAIERFRAILVRDPALPRVRLELGRAFFLNGEDDNAKHQFGLALAGDMPESVVDNVNRYLDAIRERKGWHVDLSVGLAPDTNINAGPAIETVELFGRPFILSKDARERSGVGFKGTLGGQYYHPVTERTQIRLGAQTFVTEYSGGTFDDYIASFHAGPRFSIEKGDVSLLLTANKRWYGGEAYSWAIGGRIEANRRLTERIILGGAIERQEITYDRNDDASGPLTTAVAVAVYALTPNSYLRLLAGVAREDAAVDVFRNTAWRTGIGYLHEFPDGWTATLQPEVTFTDYDEKAAAYDEVRKDRSLRARVSLLNRRWSLFGFTPQLSYIYSRRNSSLDLYDFDRHQIEIGATQQF
ncbi:surface lipoprotein assembly modifier [Rhodospirillaceae bacterium SYSU D60014]|uniref:surface lipoprotein assembly modifier n=1 Tax=Virgifigura deserti TaxID=2268457 RepID=UPI0013C44671